MICSAPKPLVREALHPYTCFYDFCNLVAEYLERECGWNDIREELRTNYYCQREYEIGSSVAYTAQLVYEYDLTWED